MPTIFSHAVFAAVAGKAFVNKSLSVWFWVLTAVCAIIPDADVIVRSFGVGRGSMLAHRGFTHSFFFAVLFGTLVAFFVRRFLKTGLPLSALVIFFSAATFTHPLLDMLTDGGSGVALFAPLSNERFFFPWQPIKVSPIGLRFFSDRGLVVILSEFVWVWLPAILILVVSLVVRKVRK
jgi:inner membrane protein